MLLAEGCVRAIAAASKAGPLSVDVVMTAVMVGAVWIRFQHMEIPGTALLLGDGTISVA